MILPSPQRASQNQQTRSIDELQHPHHDVVDCDVLRRSDMRRADPLGHGAGLPGMFVFLLDKRLRTIDHRRRMDPMFGVIATSCSVAVVLFVSRKGKPGA